MLECREPQNINWLVMNAHIFLGLLLYWSERRAIPTKGFPRSGLAYELLISNPGMSNSWILFVSLEGEAECWPMTTQGKNKDNRNILSVCIYYIPGHCLSLTWMWYNKLPFGCSRKGSAKVKGSSCVCTTDIISNLLFYFSQVQKKSWPAGREQKGSPFLIPAAWKEAGDMKMLHHHWLKCRSCCSIRTRGWCYFMGLWLHLMTETGQRGRLHTTGTEKKKNHWQ